MIDDIIEFFQNDEKFIRSFREVDMLFEKDMGFMNINKVFKFSRQYSICFNLFIESKSSLHFFLFLRKCFSLCKEIYDFLIWVVEIYIIKNALKLFRSDLKSILMLLRCGIF